MKKAIIVFQILILFLFLAKLFVMGVILKKSELYDFFWSANPALAESSSQRTGGTGRDVFEDALAKERYLTVYLEDKKLQLDGKESFIKYEEQKINSLKKEISAKIDKLRGMEDKVTVAQESDQAEDKKKYKELAKAYEATPPDKVASLFNKMDDKTAAAIILQMNIKKAGAVWGNLDPVKAAQISKTIVGM